MMSLVPREATVKDMERATTDPGAAATQPVAAVTVNGMMLILRF